MLQTFLTTILVNLNCVHNTVLSVAFQVRGNVGHVMYRECQTVPLPFFFFENNSDELDNNVQLLNFSW